MNHFVYYFNYFQEQSVQQSGTAVLRRNTNKILSITKPVMNMLVSLKAQLLYGFYKQHLDYESPGACLPFNAQNKTTLSLNWSSRSL